MEEDNYNILVKYLTDLSVSSEYNGIQARKLKAQARYFLVREGILYQRTKKETLVYGHETRLPVEHDITTYSNEAIDEENFQFIILTRIVTMIDNLREACAKALGNIK
ncbi:4649_t:CDS:2 [Gigaspora margarita]|uniref:4649_t:CDS:1 n=1 Tax=Gigaspora margarita TaxID=4874 RepID=A0ABN7WT74_GIGMA|nr:4649_t:CDS:2 [Gigaspora margarita]